MCYGHTVSHSNIYLFEINSPKKKLNSESSFAFRFLVDSFAYLGYFVAATTSDGAAVVVVIVEIGTQMSSGMYHSFAFKCVTVCPYAVVIYLGPYILLLIILSFQLNKRPSVEHS